MTTSKRRRGLGTKRKPRPSYEWPSFDEFRESVRGAGLDVEVFDQALELREVMAPRPELVLAEIFRLEVRLRDMQGWLTKEDLFRVLCEVALLERQLDQLEHSSQVRKPKP